LHVGAKDYPDRLAQLIPLDQVRDRAGIAAGDTPLCSFYLTDLCSLDEIIYLACSTVTPQSDEHPVIIIIDPTISQRVDSSFTVDHALYDVGMKCLRAGKPITISHDQHIKIPILEVLDQPVEGVCKFTTVFYHYRILVY
jgi:hypothetical protein